MTDELPVQINREGRRELDVPDTIDVTGPFDVRFVNHGEALHVHLNADETLSRVATVNTGNRHVPGTGERRVRVDVDTDELDGDAVFGTLEVTTSYGAEQHLVDVEIADPAATGTTVEVDQSLGEPARSSATLFDRPELVVLGLGLVAVVLAALTAAIVDDPLVGAGVGVVLAGVVVALVLVLR